MDSFLTRKKETRTYKEKISGEPKPTQRNKLYAVNHFERFIKFKFSGKTVQDIVDELNRIREGNEQEYEDTLYWILQEFINWNKLEKRGNYTIKVIFSNLRKYLLHIGIKTNDQDIKEYLTIGKRTKEERYPLSQEEYKQIVSGFPRNPRLQALFLALGSSGMRVGEALNLKKKDLDLSQVRIKVNIPADTKTRTGRTTYLSKETEKVLRPILEKLDPDDYVFSLKNKRLETQSVRKSLNRLLTRIGFDKRYQSNNYSKITSHNFRAYFFTKAARKHGENYAHRLIGHGGYLMQYDRMTEEEKLEKYLELEPELTIFEQTKNELEIEKLKRENHSVNELKEEISKLKETIANQDKKILLKLMEGGKIPKFEI